MGGAHAAASSACPENAMREHHPEPDRNVVERVYAELRALASVYLRNERRGHTLQTTALANEAWMKLAQRGDLSLGDREHFLALAAQAIRRILVDHARKRAADKRGGGCERISLAEDSAVDASGGVDLLALDEALSKLATLDQRQARVVELRFFAGLEVDEVALALGVSPRTVAGDWVMAKSFLHAQLGGAP
jgi:RNA polymerase sigma factor (TIGR02999 family)